MCRKFIFWFSFVLVLGLVGNASAQVYNKDIGGPSIAGSASYDEPNDTWTVTASGADIWGNADQFHMVYRPMEGDGAITANLASMTMDPLHDWCKAGVMIRENTEAGSKHAALLITGVNGAQFGYRMDTGGGTSDGGTWGIQVPPKELTIERVGNTFTITYWHVEIPGLFEYWQTASVDIPMKADVVVGLAVTSHDNGVLLTSVYDSVVWPAGPYEKAWDMRPLDGATQLPLQPTLTWMPGDGAITHSVYLGTDPAALELVATKDVGDESYTHDTPLDEATVYYWQVVEWPGVASPILSFKTTRLSTGTILREVWEGIGGTMPINLYSDSRYPNDPTWSDELPSMASYDFADNYGARMQGYLVPETSGDYKFWIAADDGCELWLSTDEVSCNAVRIAYHNAWTGAHNWFWYGTQESASIPLTGNQKYFIRAVWKEGGGGDNCQVAWYGPDQPNWPVDGSSSAVIDGYYLMPAADPWAGGPNPANGGTFTVHEAETVSWAAGKGAISHDVYLGTDPGAMTLVATVAMPDTSCTLPALAVDQTYYWRVDAYDGTDTYSGCPWSFNTAQWISIDIGRANPWPAGGSSYDPITGEYTLQAGGNELWGQADEFHYLYTTMKMTRDTGEIKARVLSITQPDSWRRAGVQIRETRAPNARKVMAHKTGHDNTRMQWREQPSWDTWNGPDAWGLGFPTWVRVTRDGDQFSTYRSLDGENWTYMNTVYCPMQAGNYVCVGLALCHHNSQPQDQLTTGVFDNLSIYTPDPRQAWRPSPADGTQNVPLYTTLSWMPGDDADEHALYISDNYEDVLYGLVDPVVLPAGTTEYEVGPLDLTKPYYWCVDEVIQEGREWPITLGDIWSFRVEDFRLVEDFEPYDDEPLPLEPLPEQVVIVDGYIIPGYTIPAVEPNSECLLAEYLFDGDASDSSGNGRDGTLIGDANVSTGVLEVDGDGDCVSISNDPNFNFAGNFSISAWVNLNSWGGDWGNVIIGKRGEDGVGWQLRRFGGDENLSFTTRGIGSDDYPRSNLSPSLNEWYHLAAVRDGDKKLLYINGELDGTADVSLDPVASCDHTVYVGARANGDNSGPETFFDGKINDLQLYCRALSHGETRYIAGVGDLVVPDVCVPPIYGPLAVRYEFEGDLSDISGNNRDATANGAGITFEDDPEMGMVLSLPGGDDIYVSAPPVGISGNDPTTIACWAKADHTSIPDWTLIFGFTTPGGDCGSHFNIGSIGGPGGVGAHVWCWEATIFTDQEALDWRHYAMTFDGGTLRYYGDGSQIGELDYDLWRRGDYVNIGKRNTQASSFPGKVDDARVYNEALSWGQILTVMEYTPDNPISGTWSENGATLSLDYFEQHWGAKSMKVESSGAGEVNRETPFKDWDSGEAKGMVMYFKGDPCNVIDDLYMGVAVCGPIELASTTFSYDGDIDDLKSGDWTEWNIDLTGLGSTTVRNMALGIVGTGTVHFDDLRLYPIRCVAEYGPMADFTGDCKVDGRDLRIHASEWLAETQVQDWEYRAVYYDARYPTGWAETAVAEGVRDYLSANGYTVLDADELKTWMDDRIADGALSVVVMSQDIAPDTVAETRDATCTLRRYLDAGGKVVQYADIPFYNQGHADGTTTNWATDGSVYILGFNAAGAGWDSGNTITITGAGANWGLTHTHPSNRPAIPTDVDTILATEDDGDAAAWQKAYVSGDFYRGFVYIADFDVSTADVAILPDLLSVAEYRGGFVSDMDDDGSVNFRDYALIGNEWLVEQLWP
jgi:regulation of enolase protein 1 (concanavalin A-like superfamily)